MFGECHAHIFMNGRNYMEAVRLHRDHVNEESIRSWFAAYADKGIHFVRDGGDGLHVSEYARKLAPEYGIDYRTPLFAIHRKGHYGKIVGLGYEDLQEYHALVRSVRTHGGDFVKIMVSGIMEYETCGRLSEEPLSENEIRELIHIAHGEGMAVMVHGNGAEAVRAAVLAGADSIEHGNYIDRDCIDAMEEMGTVWVPTVVTISNLFGCGRYPETELHRIFACAKENLTYAWGKKVHLALGSDAGAYLVPHGEGLLDEYRIFCGMFGEREGFQERLLEGETRIREKFQEEGR